MGFLKCMKNIMERLIYYFTEMGYSVYAIEHRDMEDPGFIWKKTKSQISIDKFEYYVRRFKRFS